MSGPIHQLINNFNGGELSPLMDARADTGKYRTGCRRLRNFIPRAVGGVFSRPGTEYMGAAKYGDRKAALIPFNFSRTTSFQIELGDGYVRFWSNRQQVQKLSASAWVTGTPYAVGNYVSESGTIYYCVTAHTSAAVFATDLGASRWVAQDIYELPSPYEDGDLFEIQFTQINDIIYLVHPKYAPRKLSRLADDHWTLVEVVWDWPALLDENVTSTTITPSATTGSITLTASTGIFQANHVGAYFQVAHRRSSAYTDLGLHANGVSAPLRVIGSWEFGTAGTWASNVEIERSEDGGTTWQTVRTFRSLSDRNVAPISYDEATEVLVRLRVQGYVSHTAGARAWLEAVDSKIYGLAKITGYTSATQVSATVINSLGDTAATTLWSEGAWSPHQGYPRTVAFHEQRVVYGGTAREPVRIWGSAIGDFENFRKSSLDEASFDYVLASTQSSQVQWMTGNSNGLIIGTAAEEWLMHSGSDATPITPTTVKVSCQSSEGSEHLMARLIKNVVLFVQRYGRTVSEMAYSFEEDSLKAQDLTILSEHVTEGGIKQTAFQSRRDAILWAVTGDGKLIGLTYQREHEVTGWHVHETEGEFESVSVNYSANGTSDEVWFVVKRTIEGQTVRYLESFQPAMAQFDYSNRAGLVCMDSARTYSGVATDTITGLGHLEGEVVSVRADGATQVSKVVSGGSIALDRAAEVVVVGLPFTPLLQPTKIELQLENGGSRGRLFRPVKMILSVHESLGAEISPNPNAGLWEEIPFRRSQDVLGVAPPLRTDDMEWDINAPYTTGVQVAIRQRQPQPLNLLAMVCVFSVDS
ncbi:hypothetical protein DES53_115149 [Roseimicrobium gellanilyticum]|uniref:Uncharacterized protein n=1 Tax=Roseimicrobium gellanilyticum TaxID=748857 RepID=A0A366H518_9BACT|nr:hypothetical protein [Roseimicrobium gellanilyticum]RBP37008.1 hypothetical protein DES53_115149 [Roseimicrobium gellanilyticum]